MEDENKIEIIRVSNDGHIIIQKDLNHFEIREDLGNYYVERRKPMIFEVLNNFIRSFKTITIKLKN